MWKFVIWAYHCDKIVGNRNITRKKHTGVSVKGGHGKERPEFKDAEIYLGDLVFRVPQDVG